MGNKSTKNSIKPTVVNNSTCKIHLTCYRKTFQYLSYASSFDINLNNKIYQFDYIRKSQYFEDSNTLAVVNERTIEIFLVENKDVKLENSIDINSNYIPKIYALSLYQQEIYLGIHYEIHIYNITPDSKKRWNLSGHNSTINSFCHSKLYLFSGSCDYTIIIWDSTKFTKLNILNNHRNSVNCLAIQNHLLFSASQDKTIKVWDISKNANLIHTIVEHKCWIYRICLYRHFLFSGGYEHVIKVFDMHNKFAHYMDITGLTSSVSELKVYGRFLFCKTDCSHLIVWNLETWRQDYMLRDFPERFTIKNDIIFYYKYGVLGGFEFRKDKAKIYKEFNSSINMLV